MTNLRNIYRDLGRRKAVLVLLGLVVVLSVAVACGEEATPTPVPATATPVPPTATPLPPGVTPPPATATPVPATATPLPPGVTPPPATATPVPPTSTPVPPGVTPPPATATPVPVPATATPVPAPPTATPVPSTGLRPRSEWTKDNPATLEEIEAELQKYRGQSFVFVGWGGASQAGIRNAHLVPFQEKFGIEIIEDSPVVYPKVRAMAESGNVTWHVFDMSTGSGIPIGLAGALEELDPAVVDTRDWLEQARTPWSGGGGYTWDTQVAYSLDTYPEDGPQPKTMADVFDPDKFPGKRSFGGPGWGWKPNLRFALLSRNPELLDTAAGRATLSRLSDEQVQEAFDIWREFRPNVHMWWSSGADCPSLLISGELDICTAWNGRIFDAQQAGASIKVCWECGHMLSTDFWGVPKGLKAQDPEKFELVQLFLAWTAFPEQNARMSLSTSYGPVNMKSLPYLDAPEYDLTRDALPSSANNIPYAILEDEQYDGQVGDRMVELWTAFQLE